MEGNCCSRSFELLPPRLPFPCLPRNDTQGFGSGDRLSAGLPLNEIGSSYGTTGTAVSQSIRRFTQSLTTDKKLKDSLTKILKKLNSVES